MPVSSYQPWAGYNPAMNSRASQPIDGLIRVNGMEGAKAYPLPPNSCIPLFDGGDDILYVKTTDGGGFPSIRMFTFQEIVNAQQDIAFEASYASKDDVEALSKQLAEISARIDKWEM